MSQFLDVRPREYGKMIWLKRTVLEALLEGKTINICCASEERAKETFNEFVEFFKVINNGILPY